MGDGGHYQRTPTPNAGGASSVSDLIDALTPESYENWSREEKFRENIRGGNPEYNRGGYDVEDLRHSPHNLLQCPRKIWYRERNAPGEVEAPHGIFELGSYVEEEVVEPWLDSIARDTGYFVANSVWVEGEFDTGDTGNGTVQVKGSTDPVFCDGDGVPKLLTEIKSKQSLSRFDGTASRHHKAQTTAYQAAIARTYGISPPPALIVYIGRKHLDVAVVEHEFDVMFFGQIKEWMSGLTECRIEDVLPPQKPEMGWECNLCPHKERCGQGDEPWEGLPAEGFVPRMEYPWSEVEDYMAAHPDGFLTPTIAYQHPDLADQYPVGDWMCPACGSAYAWDKFDWDGDVQDVPWCSSCVSDRNTRVDLRGSMP